MELGICSQCWFCSKPDNQCRVSRSHPSFVQVKLAPTGWESWLDVPFCRNSWIYHLISSFFEIEWSWIDSLGRGTLGVISIKCLTWKCKGTLIGEDNMSLYSFTTLSTCFFFTKYPFLEAMDVATIFPLILERISKRKGYPIWEMILLNFLENIK